MKRVFFTAMVMATILAGAATGNEPMNNNACLQWGPVIEGCRFSIASDRESYQFGQPICLRMTIENVSEKTIRLGASPSASILDGFRFDMRLPDGRTSRLTLEGERQSMLIFSTMTSPLEPAKSATVTIASLNRVYDMSVAGEYRVTVFWQLAKAGDDGQPIQVQSNTIKVVVEKGSEFAG